MASRYDSSASSVVLSWLAAATEHKPVPQAWVPGASRGERSRLTALGGLVGALLGVRPEEAKAFAFDDLAAWLAGGPTPPEDVILAGKEAMAGDAEEWLAGLYSQLVSGRSRRTLGTFFTPRREVAWMVDRWTAKHHAPESVVDVGAGVGIFTTVAAQTWPESAVWAVDINPITLGLLALRVHAEFPLCEHADTTSAGLRLALADFTRWLPAVWPTLPGPRLILGNPPYTRLQLLPADQRERLWDAARGLCGRRASLSALMTAMSLMALSPEDGLCLLLPAQWLESDYAEGLRSHLWALTSRRVEVHLFDTNPFEGDAQVDAVALMVGPEEPTAQPFVFSREGTEHLFTTRDDCPTHWRRQFDGALAAQVGLNIRLADVLSVRRGAATGANQLFVMTEAARVAAAIERRFVTPLVRRLVGLPDVLDKEWHGGLADTQRYWLLTVTAADRRQSEALNAYLATGEADEVAFDRRHLCANRLVWFDVSRDVFHPDLVIGQSTKDAFRIVEVNDQVTLLNNLYGMWWKDGIDAETKADILTWLRSDGGKAAIEERARHQGLGLRKIEPRALLDVRLPDRFKPATGTLG